MKISSINFCANNPNKISHEDVQNKVILNLYKKYQEKPFEYAIINYHTNKQPDVKIGYPKKSLKESIKNITSKFIKFVTK